MSKTLDVLHSGIHASYTARDWQLRIALHRSADAGGSIAIA